MGIPLLAGREFRDEDSPATSEPPPVTFQTRSTLRARRTARGDRKRKLRQALLRGSNPIGITCPTMKSMMRRERTKWWSVKDVHYFGLRQATEPMVYVAVWRPDANARSLVLRTSRQTTGIGGRAAARGTALDPTIP